MLVRVIKNCGLLAMCLLAGLVFADPYYVKEDGENLALTTPWGTKVLMGEMKPNQTTNYHIEIPIDNLKPKPPEKSEIETLIEQKDAADQKEAKAEKSPEKTGDKAEKPEDKTNDRKVADEAEVKKAGGAAVVPDKITVEYDDTDRLVVEANHLFNQGRFFEASEDIEELIRKNPTYLRGWVMKGSLMYVQNQKDLARKAWEHALTLEPNNVQIKGLLERYR